ncbi:hypothetical protein NG791_16835 [Laspinema sp. D1]|uniref:hypothetical protein n=1 Tax=Laspinema palackyanum TaxID=3231601 RepID=UPI00346F8540|nr:hypothetical protein [Laspinema sp. D2b]
MSDENRPSPEMEEVYKDFAVIHADAERALNLLRGLDEKLKKAIAATTPERGNGDRWYQFYGLRMNCLDCTAALLKQFDSEFAQDILRAAEVAIAEECGYPIPPEWIEEAKANKAADIAHAMAEAAGVDAEAEEGEEAIAEISPALIKLLLELSKALGKSDIPDGHKIREPKGLEYSLAKLMETAQTNNLIQKRKDRQLNHAVTKIQNLVLPLLNIAIATDSEDEDGNWNEDKDTLTESAAEILERALREIREADIPY